MLIPTNVGGIGKTKVFPQVAATATSEEETIGNPQTITIPSGVQFGDLLIVALVFIPASGDVTASTPSGWTILTSQEEGKNFTVYYKTSNGTETTVDVTTSVSTLSAHNAIRIAKNTWTGTPEGTTAFGTDAAPNPPSETASWGSDKNLFIALGSHFKNSNVTIDSAPTNYTGFVTINADHDDSDSDANQAMSFRELEADSDDPGLFSVSSTSSSFWWASTLVIQGR